MPTKTFPGQYDSLAKISDFVALGAQEAGLSSKDVYAVRLAVDEACTNIIEHGYGGESVGKIECTYSYDSQTLTVKLRDWGKSFAPEDIPDPDYNVPLEELKLRGAGLYLMRELMDDIRFHFNDAKGNVLVMRKHK
jgi:serine/threonine-protein kinase RsbW